MGDLLQAELYKMYHCKTLTICVVFVLAIELVNGFLHGGDQIGTMILLMEIIGLVACALFAGAFVCTDFSHKTVYHTLTSGKSRACVWFSRYLAYSAACLLLLLINALAVNGSVIFFHNDQLSLAALIWPSILGYTIGGMIYDLCLVSVFFLIAMQIKESGLTIAISVILTGLIIANSDLFWVDRLLPLLTPQINALSIPTTNCLLLLLLPCLVALLGIGLFKRCRL